MNAAFIQKKIEARKTKKENFRIKTQSYIRKEVYDLDTVFDKVPENVDHRNEVFADFGGDRISMNSARYQVFRKSVQCVTCGLNGSYFAKERQLHQNGRFHFNLYGIRPDGTEVLFTKDHIVPKSKGGSNSVSNYQTMCSPCNQMKGNLHLSNKLVNAVAKAIGSTPNVWKDELPDGTVNFCRYGHPHLNEPKVVILETHTGLDEGMLAQAHFDCINRLRAVAAIIAYEKDRQ